MNFQFSEPQSWFLLVVFLAGGICFRPLMRILKLILLEILDICLVGPIGEIARDKIWSLRFKIKDDGKSVEYGDIYAFEKMIWDRLDMASHRLDKLEKPGFK